jgi:hypothetical protein
MTVGDIDPLLIELGAEEQLEEDDECDEAMCQEPVINIKEMEAEVLSAFLKQEQQEKEKHNG